MEDKYMDYNNFINDTENMTGGKNTHRYRRKTCKGGDTHGTNDGPLDGLPAGSPHLVRRLAAPGCPAVPPHLALISFVLRQ